MTFSRKALTKYIRLSLAGFMSVWLSGVLFLLCCGQINGKSNEPEFCPLAKMSAHCDKAKQANPDVEVFENSREAHAGCCGFLPVVFEKARKIERNQQYVAVAPNAVVVRFDPPVQTNFAFPAAFPYSRVIQRTKVFLINCTFRI